MLTEAKARVLPEGLAAAAAAAWRCNTAGVREIAVDMAATRGRDQDSVPMWPPVSRYAVVKMRRVNATPSGTSCHLPRKRWRQKREQTLKPV